MATLNPDGTPKSMMQLAAEELARQNTITPTLTTFDESKGVAGRVGSIIGADSPLMQQAATKGTQIAAQRGLTNSSLAAEASQQAVLGAATPIATADASLFNQGLLANQNASNSAKTTNAQMGVSAGLQGMQMDAQIDQFAKSLGLSRDELAMKRDQFTEAQKLQYDQLTQNQSQFTSTLNANQGNFQSELQQRNQQFAAQQAQQLVMQGLDLTARKEMAAIEAAYKTELQGSVNISGTWQTMLSNISALQNNANLDPQAKTDLINNQLATFRSYASFWQKTQPAGTSVADLLDFGLVGNATPTGAPAAPTPTPGTAVGGTFNPSFGQQSSGF